MSKVYVGDTGTVIQLDTGQNLTTATAVSIEASKPNGAVVSWAGVVVSATKVEFVTGPTTLDISGKWVLQAKVVLPSGTWRGESANMTVYPVFQ